MNKIQILYINIQSKDSILKSKTKKGYTLIELLITISIIIILMRIFIPRVSYYKNKTVKVEAENIGRQIASIVLEDYIRNDTVEEESIKRSTEELLEDKNSNIEVQKNSKGKDVSVNYTVKDKRWQVKVKLNENNFEIKEVGGTTSKSTTTIQGTD